MLPHAKKTLGQHWLTDIASLESIVDAAHVHAGDAVLEIGPGTGTLTDVLIDRGAEVTALEYDTERADALQRKYQGASSANVKVQYGDIRIYDLSQLPQSYKIVANIPYYLTANLLRKLVDDTYKPSVASLLVQKEVAQRIKAKPGSLSLIAVLVQNEYTVNTGDIILKDLFTPPPKVDSQVLILHRRPKPLYAWDAHAVRIIKAGFAEKRKKLKSSLASGLGLQRQEIETVISRAGVSDNTRAQELSHDQWNVLIHNLG